MKVDPFLFLFLVCSVSRPPDSLYIQFGEVMSVRGHERQAEAAVTTAAGELLTAWCERRDVEARRLLIEQHLPLVRVLASRFVRHGEQLDDLAQIGAVGLIKAVDRFDASRGNSLVAYAVPTILGEIRRHLRDGAQPVRLPRDGRDHAPVRAVPLDVEAEAARDAAAERRLELGEERILIARGLRKLARRERRIVSLRYFGGLSQRRIAAELGLSQVHVSRLLNQSLGKLRAEIGHI
jgi:RNA polymerase sigma-B factor